MPREKSDKHTDQDVEALLGNLSIYLFVLGILSFVWMITGFGYYWPIWFLIGWLVGPHSLPFFKTLFATAKSYSALLLEHASRHSDTPSKGGKTKSSSKNHDDSDHQGA